MITLIINVSPSLPNLRLEAKLRAEKGGKKNQEAIIADNGGCQDQGKDKIVTIAMENSRRRRSKESRHYLSMDLSSEDIAFLGQQNTYRREEMNN
ncbi:hypothetical protein IGI04_006566 [Brassica rapa subsp. trilocularis]|uniref:Uncharacterized protein n=1 Tax=Brassica rapa subsp. trilocularis TaxID=1813537 RepID=A0ABQ7NH88_BRACM|nr:hypothetical protein IGI04_006566 [Brassica rapa subsp. trilocularis]